MTVMAPTRRQMEEKLRQVFVPEQAASLVDMLDIFREMEIERAADTRALKQGLTELTHEVKSLAVAQRRTDEQLADLTVAQQRTDERLADLTVAQQRTEERLTDLAIAQQRTEDNVSQLGRAVKDLTRAMADLQQAVGNMVNRFGFDFEEFVAALLPPWLERNYGIVDLVLERRYFDLGDGTTEEVALVGTGQQDGRPLMVLVECRTTIGGGSVRKLAAKLDAVAATVEEMEVAKVLVAMSVHPTAEDAAAETEVLWIVPYSRINRERG